MSWQLHIFVRYVVCCVRLKSFFCTLLHEHFTFARLVGNVQAVLYVKSITIRKI